MDTDRVEKLLVLALLDLAELRAEVQELRERFRETMPHAWQTHPGVEPISAQQFQARLDLLQMMLRTEELQDHWNWAIRQRYPEQGG